MEAYCVKCKVKKEMKNAEEITMKGNNGMERAAVKGECIDCGTRMFKILGHKGEVEESRSIWKRTLAIVRSIFKFILKGIGVIIIIVLLVNAIPKVIDFFRPKSWTLFLYSSETPDTYYEVQRIEGYNSQTECLEKGFDMSREIKGSYECGYYCRYDKYGLFYCDKVCGQRGCRD